MKTFLTIWGGQVVSFFGSGLTRFALGVWLFQSTGSATLYGLAIFVATVPDLLVSPLAGTLVDRWDRRLVMIGSDMGAVLCTLILAVLLFGGRLEIWHLFVCIGLMSALEAFQTPAYTASMTLLVPKKKLGKANGLLQFGLAGPQLLAPPLAGFLIVWIQVQGVLLIDVATFLVALATLSIVRIPRAEASAEGQAQKGSLWAEARQGWRFIATRRGLLWLLGFAAVYNLFMGMAMVSFAPLVLSVATAAGLGIVMAATGAGMLAGSILLSVWGGPQKRKMIVIIAFWIFDGLVLTVFSLPLEIWVLAIAGFFFSFFAPITEGLSRSIWQRKVPADLQGRVFALRRMTALSMTPLAYLTAGPLIDLVFSPLMAEDGALAGSLGRWIGVGAGRGAALLFLIVGAALVLVTSLAMASPRVRRLEEELPDAIDDADPGADARASDAGG